MNLVTQQMKAFLFVCHTFQQYTFKLNLEAILCSHASGNFYISMFCVNVFFPSCSKSGFWLSVNFDPQFPFTHPGIANVYIYTVIWKYNLETTLLSLSQMFFWGSDQFAHKKRIKRNLEISFKAECSLSSMPLGFRWDLTYAALDPVFKNNRYKLCQIQVFCHVRWNI